MLEDYFVDGGTYFGVFLARVTVGKETVESGTAHAGQTAHRLDSKGARHRHQFPDLGVDAIAPELVLLRR